MVAIVNPYFPKDSSTEQDLYEKLTIESIQVIGHSFYYLPRNLQVASPVMGEDILSKFELAIPLEMYMADATGFQGDKEIFGKFGVEIKNSFTLVVSKKRWETEVKAKFDGTVGVTQAGYDLVTNLRPQEGDLIYDPLTTSLYEIKFVDHDQEFYKIGRNYMYHFTCETFQYASERIETGVAGIDIFTNNSLDQLLFQLLTENGDPLVTESQTTSLYILLDTTAPAAVPNRPYGTDFPSQAPAIGFDPDNPFGED
jgi:hypothetical protein